MSTQRNADSGTRKQFRTERFFCQEGLWYFNTREGTIEGPYATRKCAAQYLQTFIALSRISDKLGDMKLVPTEAEQVAATRRDKQRSKTWDFDPFHSRYGIARA